MDWTNKNNFLKWLVIILLAFNLFSLLFIWMNIISRKEPPGMMKPEGPPDTGDFMRKELNLSDEQSRLFEAKRDEFFKQSDKLFKNMAALQNELNNRLINQTYNSIVIDSLSNMIGNIQANLEILRFNHFKDLLSICSPEQREKFIPIIKEIVGKKPPNDRDRGPGNPKDGRPGKPPFKPDE